MFKSQLEIAVPFCFIVLLASNPVHFTGMPNWKFGPGKKLLEIL